ncbi:MAG TPA: hypothetical protein VNJ02_10500 [Vicinamibacterales bacterium]|nr:hypothetical protein [Vicinamibacterales bacterium]
MTATVVYRRKQQDGDWHLTIAKTVKGVEHKVVVEIIPLIPLEAPRVGQVVKACGISRIDRGHGGWAEIHPAESITVVGKKGDVSDVLPGGPGHDQEHRPVGDTEAPTQSRDVRIATFVQLACLSNERRSQLRDGDCLASGLAPFFDGVASVTERRFDKQMIRTHTPAVVTAMAHLKTSRYLAVDQRPRNAMRFSGLAVVLHDPVTAAVDLSEPDPATNRRFSDSAPEPLGNWYCDESARSRVLQGCH